MARNRKKREKFLKKIRKQKSVFTESMWSISYDFWGKEKPELEL